jgi:hypothetical protein
MYGIASVQAYTYFRGRPSDTIFFRTLVSLQGIVSYASDTFLVISCMVKYLRANHKWYRINTVNERLADTIQLVFITHALYYYMVTNYDNPIALLYPNWYALGNDIIDKILTSPIKEHSRKIHHC